MITWEELIKTPKKYEQDSYFSKIKIKKQKSNNILDASPEKPQKLYHHDVKHGFGNYNSCTIQALPNPPLINKFSSKHLTARQPEKKEKEKKEKQKKQRQLHTDTEKSKGVETHVTANSIKSKQEQKIKGKIINLFTWNNIKSRPDACNKG